MENLEKKNTVKSSNQVSQFVTYEGKEGGNLKVMFVGNSITRHAPKEDIGWFGNWGMAASKKENDYVHRVMAYIQEKNPDASFCIVQAAEWERSYYDFDYDKYFAPAKDFCPDIIICGLSENVPWENFDKTTFAEALHKLATYLKGEKENCLLIQGSGVYMNDEKDEAFKLYTEKYNIPYVSMYDISKDKSNLAIGLFEHDGVQIHPGDKGMQVMAERYIEVLKKKGF